MIRKNQVKSVVFFVLVTALPLLKVFLLGSFGEEGEQAQYIRVYFWIQFLVPIVDLGYYWSMVRCRLVDDKAIDRLRGFSFFGLLLALLLAPVNLLYTQILLLAVFVAWYNFRLQVFRIDGDTGSYYSLRLCKVSLDAFFVCCLFLGSLLTVEMLILFELVSVLLISSFLLVKEKVGGGFYLFGMSKLFSLDYLYTLLKVIRSNFVRLLIPLLFIGQGIETVLFVVLFYELMAQFLSIEKLHDLLQGKVNVISCIVIYVCSLPIQYLGIYILAIIMAWEFSFLNVICVILGGSARIFAVYSLKAVKNNGFDLLVWLNVLLIFLGGLLIYGFKLYSGEQASAQIALLLFYAIEAFVGLGLIFWFERSKLLKSK